MNMKKTISLALIAILLLFSLFACGQKCDCPGGTVYYSDDPCQCGGRDCKCTRELKHDIDSSLYGKWETESGSLTIEFTRLGGIKWGGAVGSMYNNLPADKWTAKNGSISTTYQGSTTTVWNYTINGSGELVLTSPTNPNSTHALVRKSGFYGDFEYEITDSKVTITGYTGKGGAVTIPSTINGKPVVAIGDNFCSGDHVYSNEGGYTYAGKGLTSVVIPDSVTYIGAGAFSGNQLTSVTIGANVELGSSAFPGDFITVYKYVWDKKAGTYTCPAGYNSVWRGKSYGNFEYEITDATVAIIRYTGKGGAVNIPSTIDGKPVTAIKDGPYHYTDSVFKNKNLTSVVIPNSVTYIGNLAFADNLLTSVTIPNSVTSIGNGPFNNNPLTSVTIGANVTLGYSSFLGGFDTVYNNGGKLAGTYIFTGTVTENEYGNLVHTGSWSKQP